MFPARMTPTRVSRVSCETCVDFDDDRLLRFCISVSFAHSRMLMMSVSISSSWWTRICKKMGDGGGGHWLLRMEWHPAGWSVCLPLLIFPYTIKSRSSLLAQAHRDGPGKRAVKRLCCGIAIFVLKRHVKLNQPTVCVNSSSICVV